jgi:restriction system protein
MSQKRKTSLAEDLIEITAMMPWWVGVTLALLSFLILHHFASQPAVSLIQPGQFDTAFKQNLWRGIATFAQYLFPMFFLGGAAISAWRRHTRQSLIAGVAQVQAAHVLDGMTWRQFELLVGESFRGEGYKVKETGGGGADGGVDLVLIKGGEKFLVQCKQWKAFKVGVEIIRELYGVMAARGATGGFVVTSGRFTQDAEDFASGRNVILIDGPKLHAMIHQSPSTKNFQPSSLHAQSPACPQCAKTMVKRSAKRGANAGKEFWGCAAYPACHGMRNMA